MTCCTFCHKILYVLSFLYFLCFYMFCVYMFCLILPFVVILFVFIYIFSLFVLSLYTFRRYTFCRYVFSFHTFGCYTFCLFIRFVSTHFVRLSLHILSLNPEYVFAIRSESQHWNHVNKELSRFFYMMEQIKNGWSTKEKKTARLLDLIKSGSQVYKPSTKEKGELLIPGTQLSNMLCTKYSTETGRDHM